MNKPYDICERTFQFALAILQLCQRLERQRSSATWTIGRQILRSATSIGANVEEAQGAQSQADFVSKYSIARKETRETRYRLRLLLAGSIVTPEDGQSLLHESEELLRILTAIIKKVRQK